jgi:hypothetical protein
VSRLQLDLGIIAACAPTLRPLLGRALRLSTSLDPHRGANYYRAGKALDRLPITRNSERRYLRENTTPDQFIELVKRPKHWDPAGCGEPGFLATAVHAEHVQNKGECSRDRGSTDEDAILPLDGIVKTMMIKVEK